MDQTAHTPMNGAATSIATPTVVHVGHEVDGTLPSALHLSARKPIPAQAKAKVFFKHHCRRSSRLGKRIPPTMNLNLAYPSLTTSVNAALSACADIGRGRFFIRGTPLCLRMQHPSTGQRSPRLRRVVGNPSRDGMVARVPVELTI